MNLRSLIEKALATWTWQKTRDVILFFGGLVGVAHETLSAVPNGQLLILFAAMMGLPAFLPGKDDR